MRAPLHLLLVLVGLAPVTAQALVTDYFVYVGTVRIADLAVEADSIAVCASATEGTGVIEQSWMDWYGFHFVLTSSCGSFPLDFEANGNADGTFDVRGYLETPSARGWCTWDEESYGALRCDVTQGALHVRGTFEPSVGIF